MSVAPRQPIRTVQSGFASKVIEAEAVIIDLESGAYYSLEDAGALIWQALSTGSCIEALTVCLLGHFDVKIDTARRDVEQLVGELLAHGLVESLAAEPDASASPQSSGGGRLEYRKPQLEVYDDMAELLALDPPSPGLIEGLKTNPEDPA